MDIKDIIKDLINRIILNPRDSDPIYILFKKFKQDIQSFSNSELNFPYYNTEEYGHILDTSFRMLAFLRTLNHTVTYKGFEYSDLPILWRLESFGFTPLKYLSQDHYRRTFMMLPSYYKSKGAFGRTNAVLQHILRTTAFFIQEFDVARGENNDPSSFILQGLPDTTDVIISAADLHQRDPLWKLILKPNMRLPTRSPYIMVSKRATLTDLYIDALLLHHLSLRELEFYIDRGTQLNKIIESAGLGFLSISECWLFISKLLKLIYKYTSTQPNSLRYVWNSTERIFILPALIDICENESEQEACRHNIKTVLRQHLDFLFFEWYDILFDFVIMNYNRLLFITEDEIINYIRSQWIGYTLDYETMLVNSARDILPIIRSMDIFNIIMTTKADFYSRFVSTTLIPYYDFHNVWKPELYNTFTQPIPRYLDQLAYLLNDTSQPSAESMYSSLLYMINPNLVRLVDLLDEELYKAQQEVQANPNALVNPLQDMLIQVYAIISMIAVGLSDNVVYKLTTFNIMFPTLNESNVISVLLRFFLPHYVRALGDLPEYSLIIRSIFHGYAPTTDRYDRLDENIILDSSHFIGQYYYNRGFTINKPIRTKQFNLDQLWTTLDQGHKLNESTHILQPRHISKTMTYLDDRQTFTEVNVSWESQDIYAPIVRLPIAQETDTSISFNGTFYNEPMRWELHPIVFTDDMILHIRPQIGYIRSENNGQNYKIRKNPPNNIPADVKPRMKTYSDENIEWMRTLLNRDEVYHARYADDLVWIASEKDNRVEYVYVVNQN